jgi:hypothetical protein
VCQVINTLVCRKRAPIGGHGLDPTITRREYDTERLLRLLMVGRHVFQREDLEYLKVTSLGLAEVLIRLAEVDPGNVKV